MAETKMTMRLIVNEGDIRKLTVNPRPNTVDDLINWIKTTIQANYEFTLQYDEPEFDNASVNLRDMSEVPEKPTIRIIPIITLTPVPVLDSFSETSSQADTEILSVSSSSVEVRKEWPDPFIIPKFSVSVEYQLRQGNLTYLRDATYLKISKDLKHCILDRLAEAIYSYKAYPEDEDIDDVAKALVAEHPCLKERGSSSGYQGWKNSLKFKMGNYRNDMRKLGHPDVTVNAGKRGKCNSDGEPPHKNIKKPRKGEVNYLPDFPEGMDSASLETAREAMVDEMKKKSPDVSIIKHAMNTIFALRRAEVVKDKPDISQMVQRWPALFTESQVCDFILCFSCSCIFENNNWACFIGQLGIQQNYWKKCHRSILFCSGWSVSWLRRGLHEKDRTCGPRTGRPSEAKAGELASYFLLLIVQHVSSHELEW